MPCTFYNSSGDMFEDLLDAKVNPVNCYKVDGAGLALQFKKRYPKNSEKYHTLNLEIGKSIVSPPDEDHNFYIINVPTKYHWKNSSTYEYVRHAIYAIRGVLTNDEYKIESIGIPVLGCGLGGLDKEAVTNMIILGLESIDKDIQVVIYNK